MSIASCTRLRPWTPPSSTVCPSSRKTAPRFPPHRPLSSSQRSSRLYSAAEESITASEEEITVNADTTLDEDELLEEDGVIDLNPTGMNERNQHRISRYQARKACEKIITEGERPLSEYMTLPISQYSVLDAEKVERLDGNTFKVQTSTVGFLGIKMTPVMKVTVEPHDTGCEVRLLECTLEGSQVAKNVDERFACFMRNYVSYKEDETSGRLQLTGDCVVQFAGIVPRWMNAIVSVNTVNSLGRKLMKNILDIAVPRFLEQLEKDYITWAAGDDSRQAMSTGESFGLGDAALHKSIEQE